MILDVFTSNNEVNVGEHILRLHQLPGMTLMEQIVDTISVNSYRSWNCAGLGHIKTDAH